jgi:hypothetical protein
MGEMVLHHLFLAGLSLMVAVVAVVALAHLEQAALVVVEMAVFFPEQHQHPEQ